MKQFESREQHAYIGKYAPRLVDGWKKSSGKAEFFADICNPTRFPGMLYAKVLNSPYAHARIVKIDTSKAEALPGVHTVLTCFDPEVQALKITSHAWACVGGTVSYDRWQTMRYNDQHILGDTFHSYGDKNGALVAAESEQIAAEALALLDIEWEVLPFYLNPQDALQPGAVPIHPEINPEGNRLPADARDPENWIELDEDVTSKDVFLQKGDVERGFADSDVIVEWTSSHHNANHACLDSMGCMVEWEGDQLICYTNSFQADQTRMFIANMLEIPMHKVRVICTYVGASMGRWNVGDQSFFIQTALLAKRAGRPVRFKHTRREDFHDTRLQITWTGKMGAKRDGTIQAASYYGLSDVGAHANQAPGILKFVPFEVFERQFAHIPNVRMEGEMVYTNRIPSGMMRSTGNIQFAQASVPLIDQLAEKLDMDPIDLVIKNFGQEWIPNPNESLKAVLHEGAKRMGWEDRHLPGRGPFFDGYKKRGIGFSFHQVWHSEWEEEGRGDVQVGIKINPDLSVILDAPTVETGGGSNNVALMACAESLSFLGVTLEDIRYVERIDTESSLKDAVQTDSAVALLLSEAVDDAAKEVKERILGLGAKYFNVREDALAIEDGRIFPTVDPEQGVTIKDLLWVHSGYVPIVPIVVNVSRKPDLELTGVPYQATFAEVEVDIETGVVKVVRMVIVNDAGTVLYPTGAEAQQIGGQVLGLGETLTEELVYDPRTGTALNFNLTDYTIFTMLDMPPVEPVLMEVWRGAGKYGASGIGEGTLVNTPGAVLNAIYNAVGIRVDHIPVSPADILRELNDRGSHEDI